MKFVKKIHLSRLFFAPHALRAFWDRKAGWALKSILSIGFRFAS